MLTVKRLLDRSKTYHGKYHDIGIILDDYSTQELFKFVFDNLNMKTALRYFLEQQITAHIMSIERSLSK
ncbi:MAG: hypothetical protein GX660_18315 [Clostridiaceae bacterium]|nr:hypothetical protein [Clostridiaceae bacterium]